MSCSPTNGGLAVAEGQPLALADLYGCASVPYLMDEEAGSPPALIEAG